MAAVPDEQAVSSFPNPPALFYKLYTDENVSKGIAPKPPPPVKGQYHMFGHPFDVSLSLLSSPFRDQPWAEWALKYLPFSCYCISVAKSILLSGNCKQVACSVALLRHASQ